MSRPTVVRTYGKARPSGSTSSLIFESSPPSSPLLTPHASSDGPDISDFSLSFEGKENISPDSKEVSDHVAGTSNNTSTHAKATQSTLGNFFNLPNPKKRPLRPTTTISAPSSYINDAQPSCKKSKAVSQRDGKNKDRSKDSFTQMYLTHLPLLHTCSQCLMSYVRGGEDEGLHEKHHARVTRGIIWEGLGRGAGPKEKGKRAVASEDSGCGWKVVRENVSFGQSAVSGPGKGRGKGKIVVADGSFGGTKLADILKTVDTVLCSPPLPTPILDQCKIFLFITSSPAPSKRPQPTSAAEKRNPKERIVGVVVAQGIKWAMRVLPNDQARESGISVALDQRKEGKEGKEEGEVVDSGDGVLCDSTRLNTPLGIHRLFTIPTYRSLGLAQILLDAACAHTVYGCQFDPLQGQVAFSQPTSSGRAVMEKWGKGGVRVFVDDESQL